MQQSVASYNDPSVIRQYTGLRRLFAAEDVVLQNINDSLQGYEVLDIGVGGGRTTSHLIGKVKSYTGIDFAAGMVRHCAETFPAGRHPNSRFLEMDACRLDFPSGSFDFVLFSFNGIDSIVADDRMRVLQEVFRVLKKGGSFLFSFHNIQSIDSLFGLHIPKNPLNWRRELKRYRQVKKNNSSKAALIVRDHALIKDGVNGDFGLEVMYVAPAWQQQCLRDAGFTHIKWYDLDGKEITATVENAKDHWLHAWCTK